jgi:hypothetical protein
MRKKQHYTPSSATPNSYQAFNVVFYALKGLSKLLIEAIISPTLV